MYDPRCESVASLSTTASSSAKIYIDCLKQIIMCSWFCDFVFNVGITFEVSLWNTCSDAKSVCKFVTRNSIRESWSAGNSSCNSVFKISYVLRASSSWSRPFVTCDKKAVKKQKTWKCVSIVDQKGSRLPFRHHVACSSWPADSGTSDADCRSRWAYGCVSQSFSVNKKNME